MKKINKYIKVGVIACLAAVLLIASLWGSDNVVAAPARMSGVQKVINSISESNPFTVVEIVPSKSEARFGFLVEGYEPEVPESVLKGLTSSSAREDAVRKWLVANAGNNIISYYGNIYEEQLYRPQENVTEWDDYSFGQGHKEERTGFYKKATEHNLTSGDYRKIEETDADGNKVESWEYVGRGQGDYIWVDDKTGETHTVEFQRLYYKINFVSSNWFSKQVLELDDANIEVKVMTPQGFDEMIRIGGLSWEDIDLLYLNASDSMKYGSENDTVRDFSLDAVISIYNQAVTKKLPIFLDQRVFNSEQESNVLKLAYLLKGYSEALEVTTADGVDAAVALAKENVGKINQTEGVCKNIYFGPSFVNDNITDVITDFYGELEVNLEFKNESDYHDNNNLSEEMVEKESDDKFNISRASLMKYIIHLGKERVEAAKELIRVLDIEPTRYSLLNEATIYEWLGMEQEQQETLNIEIVQTAASAFNGNMADLIETYDLIYIGGYTGPSNGAGTPLAGALTSEIIYSNEGASVEVVLEPKADSTEDTTVKTKFAENDITKSKKDALVEYANHGYPVVISDELYNENSQTIDANKVKSSSQMYGFLQAFTGNNNASNVMKQSNIQAAMLNQYVHLAKLTLNVSQKPDEYVEQGTSSGDSTSNEADEELSKLQYVFSIADDARVINEDMYYKLQLFVDSDGDGQYSDFEEIPNIQIADIEWNQIQANQVQPGQMYIVTVDAAQVNDGYVPWELRVSLFNTSEETENCIAKDSECGSTFVETTKNKIKVLQISTEVNDTFMTSGKIGNYINDVSAKGFYDIQIEHFNVVQFLQSHDSVERFYNFLNQYDVLVLGVAEDYCETPLLIGESASKISMAFYAMEDYVEAGKALLVSQDTTTYKNLDSNAWGAALNKFVRKMAGMDRYNIMNTLEETDSMKQGYTNTLLDLKLLNSNAENVKHSLSYSGVNADEATAISQVNKGMLTSFPYDLNISSSQNSPTTINDIVNNSEVMALNRIQDVRVMTPVVQAIVGTHAQSYQLDLDYDKDGDGKSDVIVWYTLAGESSTEETSTGNSEGNSGEVTQTLDSDVSMINGNAYSIMPNDVRNNYFIYSIGNVTYTGQGLPGENEDLSDYEAKLFVNTLIAAYNLGIKSPTVNVLSDKEDTMSVICDIYRPFDEEAQVFCETDQDIYFHIKDNNVLGGRKRVTINVYEKVSGSGDGVKTVTHNDVSIYLKPLTAETVIDQKDITDYRVDNHVYETRLSKEAMNSVLANETSLDIYIGIKVEFILETEADGVAEDEVFASTEETFTVLEIKKLSLLNLD